jgi:2,6-dihydroxypseudooxynicotine hydrolase
MVAGGVEYEDLQDLLQSIDSWDVWCGEWSAKGALHEALGEEALSQGRLVSAGQALHRAAVCYHFGGFRFYQDLAQKSLADEKAQQCYRKAAPHFAFPAERILVPFKGAELVGYLRAPPGAAKSACVIIIAGNDARKEEFKNLEEEFLVRGMATVSYDGPGQGEVWEHLKMRSDDEQAAMAIMDYLETRPEIDMGRIGIYGWAMGGFFSPRVAAADSRVRACVSMPVRYSLVDWDNVGKMQTDAYQHLFGNVSYDEGREIASSFTQEDVLPKVRCPFLIVHGGRGDTVEQADSERAARDAGGPTQLVVYEEGDHLCINNPVQVMAHDDGLVCRKAGPVGWGKVHHGFKRSTMS